MTDERKVEFVELTKDADAAMSVAIVKRCIAKGIPKDAQIVNRFSETANGDLRVRTFMGDVQICEVVIEKSQWRERKMN